MDSRIAKKISKCLALAAGTNNPAEAEAAMRQAHALMKKHGLTEADVAASRVTEEARPTGTTGKPPYWVGILGGMIAKSFSCKIVICQGSSWTKAEIRFIGVGCKPQLAAYTFEVLLRQLKRHRREYIATQKRCKRATKTRRADLFCQAWLSRVGKQIADFAGDERDKTAIETYFEQTYKDLSTYSKKSATSNRHHDHGGTIEGYRAAAGVTLNRPVQESGKAYLGSDNA